MAKFLILYNSDQSANETMANATPEQMNASMNEWIQWKEGLPNTLKYDWGLPLQIVTRINPSGTTISDSRIGGYAMIEGDKETIVEIHKSHPHLKRPGASIDIFEMLSMPGIEN